MTGARAMECPVAIPCGSAALHGVLTLPEQPLGLVVFVHGSGSSHLSLRNRYVAGLLVAAGFGSVLFDLLTPAEAMARGVQRSADVDIALLGRRVVAAIDWAAADAELARLPLGLYGSSTGAAAALQAAAARPQLVRALVSRGGRPDLAFGALGLVSCPTLLIVGGHDVDVLELNQWAAAHLLAPHQLAVVPGASHLFEEPGTLEEAAGLTRRWFAEHLGDRRATVPPDPSP